jgi:Cu/Ag efflux protein CusF
MKNKSLTLALTACLSIGAAGLAPLALADKITPLAGEALVSDVTGTVTSFNPTTRLMSIKTPEGRYDTFHIPPEVKRIDQIKVGDKVAFTRTEAVLVDLETGPKAGARGAVGETMVDQDPRNKPAGSLTRTMKIYGKIESVNRAKSQVTVRGSKDVVTLTVKDKKILSKLKPGDGVSATYVRNITGEITSK